MAENSQRVLAQVNLNLDAYLRRMMRLSDTAYYSVIKDADLAEELITVAEQHDADTIVIGLRQRSATGKLDLGSNAQRILLDAGCPVITVKG